MRAQTSRWIQLVICVVCFVPLGCTLATTVARAFGIPVSDDASEAARAVDQAGWNVIQMILGGLIGISTDRGTTAVVRTVKRRRAKKQTETSPVVPLSSKP